MLGIMGVHAGVYLTAGGFFFLDAFFALSGFLITSLLIVEWRKRGTIKLGAFWARRARRLLPALFVMLIGVAIIYGVFVPAGTYPTLRGDALSALFYFANWHYIASGSDYFHMTGLTSPLIHTWSLAVEEQFYLVWPLVFLGVMKLTRSLRVLLGVAVVGALASASEMALLYNPTNINRLYFGTDTHAQSVLVGATFAIGIRLWAESRRKGDESNWQARTPWARLVLTIVGAIGIAISIVLYITVHSDDAFAYRGGFLLAALAASAVLLSVSCAQFSPVARLLSFRPFTFIGRISYGMYLWHFPLFAFINEQRTGLSPWPLFFVRVIPTIGSPPSPSTSWNDPSGRARSSPGSGPRSSPPGHRRRDPGHRPGHPAGGGHHPGRCRRHRHRAGNGHHVDHPGDVRLDADPGPPGGRLPGPDTRDRAGGGVGRPPEEVRQPASAQRGDPRLRRRRRDDG